MFDGLPYRHYSCVVADPPWAFEHYSDAGHGRAAQSHYDCMSLEDIARLPVEAYAAPDSHLWMWITGPMLVTGVHVKIMRSWGFEPTAMGFVWVKLNRAWHPQWLGYIDDAIAFMGLGHTTRQNGEYCLLGRRGSPMRLSRGVRQIIFAPHREHSRKPDEAYSRIEEYCPGPRLELFGRQSRKGWTVRGNERDKFDDKLDRGAKRLSQREQVIR